MRRRVWEGLEIEAKFFDKIAQILTINLPRAYFAGVDLAQKQSIVVLEDLALRGVSFGDPTRPVDIATMEKLVEMQAIVCAMDIDERRKHDKELIRRYLARLASLGLG